jgi:hypothetical protein
MFEVLDFRVRSRRHFIFTRVSIQSSLSLDAWTSSNSYTFLAIVAHHVTNSGKLSALLTSMFNSVTLFMPEETMIEFECL